MSECFKIYGPFEIEVALPVGENALEHLGTRSVSID